MLSSRPSLLSRLGAIRTPTHVLTLAAAPQQTSAFSTTAAALARNKKANKTDSRVTLIRYYLQHPKTPRPLRFSRLRALRHWTIHRAWMLFRRQQKEAESNELYRMYQSMSNACEELRTVQGAHEASPGRLYRVAMEKKGVYGPDGVPIEYARTQTDTPATEAWNHGWTR